MSNADAAFTPSIPQVYEQLLVPMQFAPYATDIVERARTIGAQDVLETAGTGVVTRMLANTIPDVNLEATRCFFCRSLVDR